MAAHLTHVSRSTCGHFVFSRESSAAAHPGPPVILVHGLGTSSLYMVPTAIRLAADFRVYAPDLPGFGHSSKPPHALDLPALVEVLAAWMTSAKIQRADMVGNSLGCQIIAEFGVRYPDRLNRAVLQGPTIDRYARTTARQMFRFMRDLPRERVLEYAINSHDYWRTGFPRAWETMQIALADRIEEKLPRMRMPVCIVRGAHDPIVSQRWVEDLARVLPKGRLIITPGAHTPNFSEPDSFAGVVRAFLRPAVPRT
ncbi:MAG: alpha/beta hydrolase [Candidatus Dormibacteraeota bacterium]|nr:alpha/beta hydrolase [Candidatus Dormibacteraeota bacterium]